MSRLADALAAGVTCQGDLSDKEGTVVPLTEAQRESEEDQFVD